MKISENQNIFDVTLQAYGSLDFIVKTANDNDLLIDEVPPTSLVLIVDTTIGEKRVKIFVTENDFIYVNEAIEKTALLLAAEDTNLIPVTGINFIYK